MRGQLVTKAHGEDAAAKKEHFYKARVVADEENYDWGYFVQPNLEPKDMIIYEMHVRGFTMDKSSGVEVGHRGTFEGIKEKIPYLLELGVNEVELMPIFEFDELEDVREYDGEKLYNYWGYSPVCFLHQIRLMLPSVNTIWREQNCVN